MFPNDTRILIAEDSNVTRQLLVAHLKELGFDGEISEFEDGQAAWDYITACIQLAEPVQLILCDINMPNLTGIQLLRKVRQHSKINKTPFMMITLEQDKEMVMKAAALGVHSYLIKPVSMDALKEKLAECWKKTTGF